MLWERLQKYKTPEERRAVVLNVEDFWMGPFCELLRAKSREAAPDDAERALEWAGLALAVAHLVTGGPAGAASLRRDAWAHFEKSTAARRQLRQPISS
jgi:hypothetical protein